jgi:hypothetical protein
MKEFNLDISVVLKDAAMAVSRATVTMDDDGVSAPGEASHASQQLSLLNSITTLRAQDEEMEDTPTHNHQPNTVDLPIPTNPYAWAIRPGSVATWISQPSSSTAGTATTMASADTSTIQTALVQEDSSLTTTTEHIGMTEEQFHILLAAHDRKWQAKMAVEVALRVAEHEEQNRKAQIARKNRRNQTRDQTARSHGGGPSL